MKGRIAAVAEGCLLAFIALAIGYIYIDLMLTPTN